MIASTLRNERGVLTLDFLFALMLTIGLTTVLFAMSFAMSMFEVIQYVGFSASRSFYAAQISIEDQKKAATEKYSELISGSGFSLLSKSDWFVLKLNLVGAATNPLVDSTIQQRYTDNPAIMSALVGTTVDINAKFLDFQIPFLGSTTGEGGEGFKTRVTSFLGREPTQNECMDVIRERWKKISEMTGATAFLNGNKDVYLAVDDNGC